MEWHYNIIRTHKRIALPKGHAFTYRHRIEQQSCITIQNRSAPEPHLQQGSTNPEYKSTQQDLTEIKTDKIMNAGLGIQGMALAIIKVLLCKSSLTKFCISTIKTSYGPYMNLPWSVMRSWTSYQTLSQIQLKFQLLTTMMSSELSLHNRGATMIRTDY